MSFIIQLLIILIPLLSLPFLSHLRSLIHLIHSLKHLPAHLELQYISSQRLRESEKRMRRVLQKRRLDWHENEVFQREIRHKLLKAQKMDAMTQVTQRDFEKLHQVARWRPTYLMAGTMRTRGRVTWSENPGQFDETWPEYVEASVQYEEDPLHGEEATDASGAPFAPRVIRLNETREVQCNIIPSTADKSWQMDALRSRKRKRKIPTLQVDTEVQNTLNSRLSDNVLLRRAVGDTTLSPSGTNATHLPSPAARNGSLTPLSASTMRSNITMLESCPWSSEVESVNLHSNIHVVIQRYFEQTLATLSPVALTEIDQTIYHCIENSIVTLVLKNRKLRQVPVYTMEAQHITHLDLSRNKLSTLPGWFFLALEKNLHHLDLSRNYLFDLPEQFSTLRKLKRLNLSYNKLQFFPPQILELHHLNDVNVSHNSIIALPQTIIHMKLTDLDISFNWLMTLPENFAALNKRLKFFRCQDNNFSYVTRARVLTKLVSAMSHRKRAISNPHQPPKPVPIPSATTTTGPSLSNSAEGRGATSIDLPRNAATAAGPNQRTTGSSHPRSHSSDFAPEISALHRPILAEKKEKIEFFDEYDGEQASRVQMMMELLEFEQQYLRHLNILHDLYLTPLTQNRSETVQRFEMSDTLVNSERLSVILPVELHSIITFSRSFIIQLKEMMGNYESSPLVLRDITNIGALFMEQKDFLLTFYAPYIKVYDKSMQMLTELRENCPGFNKFIRSRVALPLSGGMDLESLLVLPLTRIPIYTSFIRRILRATSSDHVDHFQLKSAVVLMNECLNKQQHEIFLLDNLYKIKDIQKKLKVKKNLSVPGRVLVREGKLSLAPTRQIHQIRKEIGKYITGKKSYGDYKKIQLNPYIEAAKNKIKDKSAGDMVSDLWGIRLAELYVYVYLFNDILIVKETNMLQKLVGRVQKFDLLGSVVSPYQQKDRALSVELKNGHKLVFIAETQSQFMLWLKDFENVSTELNLRYEERQDLLDSLPIDSDDEADLSIAENADDMSDGDDVFVDLYD